VRKQLADAFLAINGVSQHKLEKHGDPFMQTTAPA
jgi:hypothetical protein